MSDCIVERADGVMIIKFNRPERMNLLGGTLLSEFNEALLEGRNDDRVRAFLVTGEGRAWNAGADLQAMGGSGGGQRNENSQRWNTIDPIGDVGRTVLNIRGADKPTIAAVNGVAVAAASGCARHSISGSRATRRGSAPCSSAALAPDCGLSWFLPRPEGPSARPRCSSRAGWCIAEEALQMGIVSRSCRTTN